MPTKTNGSPEAERAGRSLSARLVHEQLLQSLESLAAAEGNAVLWFAEIHRRKLHRQLGYASIQHYATQALGFSTSRTWQFIRLADAMRAMPRLRHAVKTGSLPWTKARVISSVATRETESRWIELAKSRSRRELERLAASSREAARRRANGTATDTRQPTLGSAPSAVLAKKAPPREPAASVSGASSTPGIALVTSGHNHAASEPLSTPSASRPDAGRTTPPAPVAMTLRFSSEAFARFESLCEAVQRREPCGSREELVLAVLEQVVAGADTRTPAAVPARRSGNGQVSSRPTSSMSVTARATTPRVHASPYQVIVYQCESCGRAMVPTSRGDLSVDGQTLKQIACDSQVARSGESRRSTVQPGSRRRVLARDGYRCRVRGCGSRRFLVVHHRVPARAGGSDDLDNLVTLCHSCHEWVHGREQVYGLQPRTQNGPESILSTPGREVASAASEVARARGP